MRPQTDFVKEHGRFLFLPKSIVNIQFPSSQTALLLENIFSRSFPEQKLTPT